MLILHNKPESKVGSTFGAHLLSKKNVCCSTGIRSYCLAKKSKGACISSNLNAEKISTLGVPDFLAQRILKGINAITRDDMDSSTIARACTNAPTMYRGLLQDS